MHPIRDLAAGRSAAEETKTEPRRAARAAERTAAPGKGARRGKAEGDPKKEKKKDRARRKAERRVEKAAAKALERAGSKQDEKPRKKNKKKKKSKQKRSAKGVDRHELYQLSVQAPDVDAPFFAKYHQRLTGRPARVLREDFCGTALLAAHWVRMHREHRAIGVDLDGPTLAWGRERNILGQLDAEQQQRIELIQADVREVRTEACDVLVALNFSYSFFMTRDALRGYLEHIRQDIAEGGLLFLDAWGGSETQNEQEEEREVEDFTYVWEQKRFDPVTYRSDCRIHFRFADGSEYRNAFRYHWRQWTLPELSELMQEAGYQDVHVLWEGTDQKTGEGNGKYRRVTAGEADPAWLAYVIGRA
jgi:SAM-dependent methyltransferase